MKFTKTTYESQPQWNQIVFTSDSGNTRVEIGSPDKDGDVEFFVVDGSESTTFFLSSENIQQLILHLQNKHNNSVCEGCSGKGYLDESDGYEYGKVDCPIC